MTTRQTNSTEELDRLQGALKKRLQTRFTPEDQEHFLKSLAADLNMPVVVGNLDCIEDFKRLGQAYEEAFAWAGGMYPDRRTELLNLLMGTNAKMLEELKKWMTDEGVGRKV